ncbi:MAG: hypothetical protein RLN96_00005 [Pseudomonadales bacterium]
MAAELWRLLELITTADPGFHSVLLILLWPTTDAHYSVGERAQSRANPQFSRR